MKIRHHKTRTITTTELVSMLAEHGEISHKAATRLFSTMTIILATALQHGHTVKVMRLGTFIPEARVTHRAVGLGLSTPAVVRAEAYKVRFRAATVLLTRMRQITERSYRGRIREKFRNPPPESNLAEQIDSD